MNGETSLLIYLSWATVMLSVSAAAILLSFLPLLRWVFRRLAEERRWRKTAGEEARREAEKIVTAAQAELAAARSESQRLLQAAQAQVSAILADGQLFTQETEARREAAFQAALGRHLNLLATTAQKMQADQQAFAHNAQQALGEAEKAHLQGLRTMTETLEKKTLLQLHGFEDLLRAQAAAAAKQLAESTAAAQRQVQAEVADYRQRRFRQLEEQLFRIIFRITERVLGRALSLQEHQELMLEALNDAKREELSHP